MPNPTPTAKVAALAELFGITPETHRHLYRQHCSSCEDGYSSVNWVQHAPNTLICTLCGEEYPVELVAPDPLGPDADGVWAVPFMWWLTKREYKPLISGDHVNTPCYACITTITGDVDSGADTFTAALLQACLAARVPEVCRAMGVEA